MSTQITVSTEALKGIVATATAQTVDLKRQTALRRLVKISEALDVVVASGMSARMSGNTKAVAEFRIQYKRQHDMLERGMRELFPNWAHKQNAQLEARRVQRETHVTGTAANGDAYSPQATALYMLRKAAMCDINGVSEITVERYGNVQDAAYAKCRMFVHKAADILATVGVIKADRLDAVHKQISGLKGAEVNRYAKAVYLKLLPLIGDKAEVVVKETGEVKHVEYASL